MSNQRLMSKRISIELKEGYWPHFVPGFFERYGMDSLFVRAAADCLTARHVKILIKAERISPNTRPRQRGSSEAMNALDALFQKMRADGAADDVLHILREATGVKPAGVLEAEVDRLYGRGTFNGWLALFEHGLFEKATALLRRDG